MSGSLAAAFAKVEGPELDLIAGYSIPPREHAPTDEAVKAAFAGFDYRPVRRIIRRLASRYRCHEADAEDAVQGTLLYLLAKRPALYRENPSRWLGLLYSASRYRLIDHRTSSESTESIEGLSDLAGDRPFAGARACIPPSLDADDESRYAPPPGEGEGWSQTQIIGAIQRFRDHHGRPPKVAECGSVHGLPCATTIHRHFGTLANAILAAGMVPNTLGQRRKRWTPLEAATTCLAFRRRNGYWPDWADVRRNPGDLPGTSAMVRFFGGTRSAEVQQGVEAILAGVGASF